MVQQLRQFVRLRQGTLQTQADDRRPLHLTHFARQQLEQAVCTALGKQQLNHGTVDLATRGRDELSVFLIGRHRRALPESDHTCKLAVPTTHTGRGLSFGHAMASLDCRGSQHSNEQACN